MVILRRILKSLAYRSRVLWKKAQHLPHQVINSPYLFGELHTMEDNTVVTLYTDHSDRFPGYQPKRALGGGTKKCQITVSLIATAYNERESISDLFTSILAQIRLPDEIIIVDAGSQDGTGELLRELSTRSKIPLKVIIEPGVNVSEGRNIAIVNATNPIIAVVDFGCHVKPDWLGNLVSPFELNPETEVVSGWYEVVDKKGQLVKRRGWGELEQINPQSFLPSSRSLAFSRVALEKAGGYPEWLTITGEDTYFDLELKFATRCWAFVPEAIVQWDAPTTPWSYWRKIFKWSFGDGEVGINTHTYRWALVKVIASSIGLGGLIAWALLFFLFHSRGFGLIIFVWLVLWLGILWGQSHKAKYSFSDLLWESGSPFAQVLGFLKGLRRRSLIYRRRIDSLKGIFFILSGIPIDDTGGGARCTQIALELLRRQYLVVFLHQFPKYESSELDILIRHPNLITKRLAKFSLREFIHEHSYLLDKKMSGVLVEFPLSDFLPFIEEFKKIKIPIIYDLLDKWDTSLGAQWYKDVYEHEIIRNSDILIATADSLVSYLEYKSGYPVVLLPNAVNSYLFNYAREYSRPTDLPNTKWYAIYIGSLWGEWFDWQLLNKIAKRYPEGDVVVIGDYQGQCPEELPNMHFLGLKAQRELPAYLYHSSVAIIPWKVTPITQATSPLKVYEYIAMGKPVVAPNIQTLSGLPGVYLAQDDEDFITKVAKLRGQSIPLESIARFVEDNDWKARVNQLLGLLQ